ncbi:MAG: SDR family oxidoreductase, partial [Dehalococcoidales bacterium]|nr:SDR family oxidoreductase [Dehalococcoidales bacterium]
SNNLLPTGAYAKVTPPGISTKEKGNSLIRGLVKGGDHGQGCRKSCCCRRMDSKRSCRGGRHHREQPIGYLGEPEDVAYGVLYLASDESRYLTGSELVIDGGWTVH